MERIQHRVRITIESQDEYSNNTVGAIARILRWLPGRVEGEYAGDGLRGVHLLIDQEVAVLEAASVEHHKTAKLMDCILVTDNHDLRESFSDGKVMSQYEYAQQFPGLGEAIGHAMEALHITHDVAATRLYVTRGRVLAMSSKRDGHKDSDWVSI